MPNAKILVVDDEQDMLIIMQTTLEDAGFEVVTAENSPEGKNLLASEIPDLVVTDIMMPGEGGVFMYRHLKTDERLKHVPVIMHSGVEKDSFYHYLNMLNAQTKGAIPPPDAYIEKPPNPEELLKTAKIAMGDA